MTQISQNTDIYVQNLYGLITKDIYSMHILNPTEQWSQKRIRRAEKVSFSANKVSLFSLFFLFLKPPEKGGISKKMSGMTWLYCQTQWVAKRTSGQEMADRWMRRSILSSVF